MPPNVPASTVREIRRDPRAKVLMVCLPDRDLCGGRLSALAEMLAPSIDVVAVEEPFADHRIGDPPMAGTAERADRAVAALREHRERARPLALFGHGTGAILAFETARRLERERVTGPVALFAAACRAPCRFRPDGGGDSVHGPALGDLGPAGDESSSTGPLADVLPLRARGRRSRFSGAECHHEAAPPRPPADPYTCGADARIRAGVLAFGAARDPRTRVADVLAWREQTTGPFESRILPGGPRILQGHLPHVANAVTDFLLPVIVGDVVDLGGPEPEPLA
ncbi:thioesterase II family protein [Actinomadura gamaensis]|uniref:Thioesterase II family protein n=1 Tax=Actinomadura gamaensis TaxID=1763541 RepID=A0ABV9TXQ3_9ACTN